MENDNNENLLLFQNKGYFKTQKQNGIHKLKTVKTKGIRATEIRANKKGNNQSIGLVDNFTGRIIKLKKEIKRNEFYTNSNIINELKIKKENKLLKRIGAELKNSIIIKIKNKPEFNLIKPNAKNNKNIFYKNITNSVISKKSKKNFIDELNMINLNESLDDVSSSVLLNQNKNNLELLNQSIEHKPEKENNKEYICRKIIKKGLIYDSFDGEEELEDLLDINHYYINPNSIFIIILDSLVFFITFYYLIYNPIYYSRYTKINSPDEFTFNEILNIIMEIILVIDFFLQFIRAYYDYDDNLIKNNRKIVIKYINSWFLIDLLCIIPFFSLLKLYHKEAYNYGLKKVCRYYCQSENLIYLLTYIKMLKIFKLLSRNQNKFISYIESRLSNINFFDDWGNVIIAIFLSLIFLHVTICVHILIGRNSYPNWIIKNNISENEFSIIYISSLYFVVATITSVGYGDITGYTTSEHIFQIFLLIIGILAYSFLVSSISNYVRENNKDITYFFSKVKILDDIRISHPEMSNELYHKIYLYLKTLKLIHKAKAKDLLFDSLPYNLKYSILYQMNKPLIEGLNFFKYFRNSSFILNAVSKLIPVFALQGDIIIDNKEIINSMIFVKQGRLSVELAIDMGEIHNKINEYITGDFIIKSEDENSDNDKKEKKSRKYRTDVKNFALKRKTTNSLMSNFNFNNGTFDSNKKGQRRYSYNKPSLKFNIANKTFNDMESNSLGEKKIKYIKLYYIYKGEQYGEIPMFLNKPSTFTLRVRSIKAELFFLKKIDAIEISSNYPNIWKRVNKKSFKNFVKLKKIVSRELIKFCDKNGIKYDKDFTINTDNMDSTFRMDFKEFSSQNIQEKKKNSIIFKNNINNDENNNKEIDYKDIILKNIIKKENIIKDKNDKNNKNNKIIEKQNKKDEIKKSTPYKEFEINDEIYDGELFLDKNSTINNISNSNTYINTNQNSIEIKDYPSIIPQKMKEDNIFNTNKTQKDLIKLIDSSRTKSSTKLHYHKNKTQLFHNKNYNVQYNINNSFNIQNVQKNLAFNSNNITIINTASFNIKKTYDNINEITNGKYSKDKLFQNKLKKICRKQYNIKRDKKVKLIVTNDKINKNANFELNKSRTGRRKSFFEKYSSQFSIKDLEQKKQPELKRENSYDKIKEDRKLQINKSDVMLNQITQNIIDGDKNLNNPDIYFNEMFKNIVKSSSIGTTKVKSPSPRRHAKINKMNSNIRKLLTPNEINPNT